MINRLYAQGVREHDLVHNTSASASSLCISVVKTALKLRFWSFKMPFCKVSLMDNFDRALLLAVSIEGNMSSEALAERVGLSASQCYRRRLRLERSGAIQGYRAIIDPKLLGVTVSAFVHLSIVSQSKHQRREFTNYVAGQLRVVSCHAVTGDADYVMHVQVADLADLNDFLTSLLARGNDRMHVRSLVVLDTIKAG